MRALTPVLFEPSRRALPPLRDLLLGPRLDRADPTWRALSVVHCVPIALEPDDGATGRAAKGLVRKHEREVKRLLSLRSGADREAFAAVREAVERGAGHVGVLALFHLLETGRLLGRLLDELALAPAVLVGELVQQLATPASIAGRGRLARAATSVVIQLALEAPADYVRLVSGLASPAEEVLTRGNQWLCRAPGAGQPSRALDLLVPALLARVDAGETLTQRQVAELQATLFGRPAVVAQSDTAVQLVAALREQLAAGATVAVELVWGSQAVCIALAVSSVVVTGTRLFTLWDGAGRITQLPQHELETRLVGYAAAGVDRHARPHAA